MKSPVFSISQTQSLDMFLRSDENHALSDAPKWAKYEGECLLPFRFINNTQAYTCSDTIFSTPLIATYMPQFISRLWSHSQIMGKEL